MENAELFGEIERRKRRDDVAEQEDGKKRQQDHRQEPERKQVAQTFDGPEVSENLVRYAVHEGPEGEPEQGQHSRLEPVSGSEAGEPVFNCMISGVEEQEHKVIIHNYEEGTSIFQRGEIHR